jgi:hypothetical protein
LEISCAHGQEAGYPRRVKIDPKAIAAGTALRSLSTPADPASPGADPVEVRVNGQPVPLDEARQALAAAEALAQEQAEKDAAREAARSASPSFFERMRSKMETSVDQAEKIIGKSKLGERALAELQSNPERVSRRFEVEVLLADGQKVPMTIDVLDVRLSRFLSRASLSVDAAGFIPFIPFLGIAIRGGATVTAWTSSAVARVLGKTEVADALEGAARKQAVLTGFRLLPIPGTTIASGVTAAVANGAHLAELRAASVGSVVSAGSDP